MVTRFMILYPLNGQYCNYYKFNIIIIVYNYCELNQKKKVKVKSSD